MSTRITCVALVLVSACGGPEFSGRCFDELEGRTLINGLSQIEMARDLETVAGDLMICNFASDVSFPNLRVVAGSMTVDVETRATVSFPSLVQTGGAILANRADIVVPQLQEAEAIISTGHSSRRLSLPALVRIRRLQWSGPVDAPELVATDMVTTGPLVAPKLTRFNHAVISPFGQSELPVLDNFISGTFDLALTSSTVVLPAVREAESISFGADTGQRFAQRIRMPRLQTADHLAFENQSELTSIDFPSLTSLKTLDAINNPKLAHCQLQVLANRTDADLNSVGSLHSQPCN